MQEKKVEFTKIKDLKEGSLYLFGDLHCTWVIRYSHSEYNTHYFTTLFTLEKDIEPLEGYLALPDTEIQALLPIEFPDAILSKLEDY